MTDPSKDMKALAEAFAVFTESTQTLQESYRLLADHARDLTQELAEKNRELALTNDYLNSILESMSDGVITIDPRGVITKFNRSATVVLGYGADEVVGGVFAEVFGRDFALGLAASSASLRAKSGRQVPVTERDAPLSDRSNKRIGYVKVFQDQTELEALREQVRHRDRLTAIGEMAATVAHEIRNPLGGLRGFAALLARDIPEEDPRARLVEKILTGARNLDRVVNELLEYTRPIELQAKPVAAAEMAAAALPYLDLAGKSVELVNEIAPELKVLADVDKMRQVLLNLLLNAVQSVESSADPGGTVRLSTEADEATVTVRIADTGGGIPPEQLEKIFSPFYTTKEKGTGLGLAVAMKIVEAHGGTLTAESELDRGAAFLIRLPRTE